METKIAKILIIDDEPQIRRLLKIIFQENNFKIGEASSGDEALREVNNFNPDIIILDLGLPDLDGQEVLKMIKEVSKAKIIILSVRNMQQDIVTALDNGADDYVVKPFNTYELLARIRVMLRNMLPQTEANLTNFSFGHISVDFSSHIVKNSGEIIKLTSTEYNFLCLFIKNIGRVMTHHYILKEIWGNPYSEQFQYLRVYVGQLRKKLEKDYHSPKIFLTEPGIGYRMNDVYSE